MGQAVEQWCNGGIGVGASIETARAMGPFHLILNSVGGQTLASVLTMLRSAGTCVTFGISEAPTSTFESGAFFRLGGARLYGLYIFEELARAEVRIDRSRPAGRSRATKGADAED